MINMSADDIRRLVEESSERLFKSYSSNRPANWSVDQRTREFICTAAWLSEELKRHECPTELRMKAERLFERKSRASQDLGLLAANILSGKEVDGSIPLSMCW